jgi:uncharacterized protein (UPF0264 family)
MQLLVSPSSIEEARDALAADIVDVKKPSEGSLGANYPWVISAIKALADKPVSAAIGDYQYLPGGASLAAYGAATAGADYIKVGLMFDGAEKARELIEGVVKAVKGDYPEKFVVIAAYGDYTRLNTISPFDMAPLAAEAGADIAMIDTGIKDGRSVFEYLDETRLNEFTASNREMGIMTALAGSLTFEDIEPLKRINPDIIGVRGMVCGGDRGDAIRPELVERALSAIR